jgi:hypothetical protein
VLRNSRVDERLRHLIASTTTALDEYRRLAAEAPQEEPPPEQRVAVSGNVTERAIGQSLRLEKGLTAATMTVEEVSAPNSSPADNLKRQLQDGKGLNRLARAELGMRGVLAWSFLDGIVRHYEHGNRSVLQRQGWWSSAIQ